MKVLSLISLSETEFYNAVQKILKQPEYKALKLGLMDYIQIIKDYLIKGLFEILKKVFSNVGTARSAAETLSTIFIIIGILVIITVVILIVVKFSKTFESKTKIKEILGEKIDDKTTPKSLALKAEAFALAKDYRQATRFNFIALLLLMHEKNVLYLDETKTNEEIYNYLKKNEFSKLMVFKTLINDFNDNWYGHKVWNEDLYKTYKDNINLTWNEVIHHENKK